MMRDPIVTVKLRTKYNGCIQMMETNGSTAAAAAASPSSSSTASTLTKMDWEKREKCLTWILIMFSKEPFLENGNHFELTLSRFVVYPTLWEFYTQAIWHAMPQYCIVFDLIFFFHQRPEENLCTKFYTQELDITQKQEISNYFCMQITWPLHDLLLCIWTLDLRFHNKIIKLIYYEYAFPCGRFL